MNVKAFAVLVVFFTTFRPCQGIRYDNYIMYRSVPTQKDHLQFLRNLVTQNYIDVIFWKKPHKLYQDVQLIVKPKDIAVFLERVRHFGLEVSEMNANVQELFDNQKIEQRYTKHQTDSYSWEEYHSLADINQWMNDIAMKFPKICDIITIGKSAENRDINALSILRKKTRGTVIVEAGLHGNEWVATEIVTYLANSLIHADNTTDHRLTVVANNYHWFLVPILNPDGYEYSHTTDRLWRKNKQAYNNSLGVDLNRNFDYSFSKFGTSNDTKDDRYCGPRPFSEPETLSFSRFVSSHVLNLKYYFSFHSFGQKIIIPYGDKILHVDNYADCENFGKQAILKMHKLYGRKYKIGNSYDMLGHKISGNSASWVKSTLNIPYVFTFLVADTGTYGYGLPPSEITPTCKEAETGVLEIMTAKPKRLRADIFSSLASHGRISSGLILCSVIIWLAK